MTSARKSDLMPIVGYDSLFKEISRFIEQARYAASRAVNSTMTATYWLVGRRIIEFEQKGKSRAKYGSDLMNRLAMDLTKAHGRGFGASNLKQMRTFYLAFPEVEIRQTVSGELDAVSLFKALAQRFPLPWSAYVRLLSVKNEKARKFYEDEALRGGWPIRHLDRQIDSMFYERTALSRNKSALLDKGSKISSEDQASPEEAVKDPFILEFLGLKDEYSESQLEEALILHLETFLLELGGDFTFVGRQRRLRIGDQWYRLDLLFFHRRLRCLVIIDIKTSRFTHADAGQMHLYLNYAREHWTLEGENPPVGLILCAQKDEAVAKYALENLPNKVLASEYRMTLPDERLLEEEIERSRRQLEQRRQAGIRPKGKKE